MIDLTEKWKAGELEDDTVYYYKHSKYSIDGTARYFAEGNECYDEKEGIWLRIDDGWKILDKVPTYEELQALKAQFAEHKGYCCCQKNEALLLENTNLRELLKYCVTFMEYAETSHNLPKIIRKAIRKLVTKINEVLK